MIENIRLKLQGKKTYLVGAGAIIASLLGFADGALDVVALGQSIVAAVMGMTIRAGAEPK